jgi:predicted nucleic acid-binding protein
VILADTSVWIDHLRSGDRLLAELLDQGRILTHPFVVGELALGSLRQRDLVLSSLDDLPHAIVAADEEVRLFIERHRLFGLGIGYIDTHLLAATRLSPDTRLWTRDRRLRMAAESLELAAALPKG